MDLPNSLDLATNQLIATTLSGIAEFENNRRKERQKQGIQAAKQAGKYKGRKSVINKALIAKVKDLKENKKLSVTEIAKLTGKSRTTIYKILKEELNYVRYNKLVKSIDWILKQYSTALQGPVRTLRNNIKFISQTTDQTDHVISFKRLFPHSKV